MLRDLKDILNAVQNIAEQYYQDNKRLKQKIEQLRNGEENKYKKLQENYKNNINSLKDEVKQLKEEKEKLEKEKEDKDNKIEKLKGIIKKQNEKINKNDAEIDKLKKKLESTSKEKSDNEIDSQLKPPVQPAEEMKADLNNSAKENEINKEQQAINDDITGDKPQEQPDSLEPEATAQDDKDNDNIECNNSSEQSNDNTNTLENNFKNENQKPVDLKRI